MHEMGLLFLFPRRVPNLNPQASFAIFLGKLGEDE